MNHSKDDKNPETDSEAYKEEKGQPKVLIGVATYEGQKYCREYFFKTLSKLTCKADYLIVTNSGEEDLKDLETNAAPIKEKGRVVAVINNPKKEDKKVDYIVSNRNLIREEFLKGDWEYLLFLDSDTIPPLNLIEVMIRHDKPLLTGAYLAAFERKDKKPVIRPVLYGFDRPGYARQLTIRDVILPRLMRLAAAGLGCCLIRKEVLKDIRFSRNKETGGTEDALFFLEAREKGFDLWCDTRIKCLHLKFPPGDKRNAPLDWRNYKVKLKAKRS